MTIRGPLYTNLKDIREYRDYSFSEFPGRIPAPQFPPFIQHDWPNPVLPNRIDQNYNYFWLPEHAIPFRQTDWPLPVSPSRIDQTWIVDGNNFPPVQFFHPENQYDWPNPQPQPYPAWLYTWTDSTPTPGQIPPPVMGRNQYDWPNPTQPSRIDQTWIQEVIKLPPPVSPFNQYYWPVPIDGRAFRDYVFSEYPGNIPPPVMGFNQYSWPNPVQPTRPDETYVSFLPTNNLWSQPFNQHDWPLPGQPPRPDESWVWYFPESETAFPFNQYSWPLPGQPPRLDESWIWVQQQQPVVPFPHNQYDWPVPKAPAPIDGYWYNPALKAAIIPLPPTNYDWPVPKGPIPIDHFWVNQVPFLTPVPPPPLTPQSSGIHRSVWLKEYEKIQREQKADVKEAAAVLSKMGGLARAKALNSKQRSAIASIAAQTRWKR